MSKLAFRVLLEVAVHRALTLRRLALVLRTLRFPFRRRLITRFVVVVGNLLPSKLFTSYSTTYVRLFRFLDLRTFRFLRRVVVVRVVRLVVVVVVVVIRDGPARQNEINTIGVEN